VVSRVAGRGAANANNPLVHNALNADPTRITAEQAIEIDVELKTTFETDNRPPSGWLIVPGRNVSEVRLRNARLTHSVSAFR
jgi:hypothetical protein